jgi:hypothetical protein
LGLEFDEWLAWFHRETIVVVPGVSHLVGVDVDGCQMLDHLLSSSEAHLRLVVVLGLEVSLGVSSSTVEEVQHFSFFVFKVVGVHPELSLNLEFPAFESRVDSI